MVIYLTSTLPQEEVERKKTKNHDERSSPAVRDLVWIDSYERKRCPGFLSPVSGCDDCHGQLAPSERETPIIRVDGQAKL